MLLWYFLPVSALTELMMKWEWICSRSVWVATTTSKPSNSSASFRAISWAVWGVSCSSGWKDWMS